MRLFAFVFLFLFLCTPLLHAQANDPYSGDPQFRQRRSPEQIDMDHKREVAMNKEREQKIKQDTAQLLELATQLKQYVDKTNENILSVDVIKKTEQIEKLAKKIRERMKEDYNISEPALRPEP